MRYTIYLLSALSLLGACSSDDDGGGAPRDGGRAGGGAAADCTCDVTVNGEAKRLTCGQSACVGGSTVTCRDGAPPDVTPGCGGPAGGTSGSGGDAAGSNGGGEAGSNGGGEAGSNGGGEAGSNGGGEAGSNGNDGVDADGCYVVSVDPGAFAQGPTTSSVLAAVRSTAPFLNDKYRLQIAWYDRSDPAAGTYDLAAGSGAPKPSVRLGIPNVIGDVLDGFFANSGTVTLTAVPDPNQFWRSAGSLTNVALTQLVVGSACLKIAETSWNTR
jgi:hypothetical protein